jgi:16S rRNA (uracil1498-N3)-methyltransferase
MPANRYFYEGLLDEAVTLTGPEAIHLSRVMRGRVGDSLELVNGKGSLAYGSIAKIGKKEILIEIDKCSKQAPEGSQLILIQALPRVSNLEVIVEKGTELGMDEIILFPAARSEKKALNEKQLQRLKNVSIAALKQSGRLHLPRITERAAIKTWDSLPSPCFFGSLSPEAKSIEFFSKKATEQLAILIGPEAGLSPEEEEALLKLGALPITLNKNILRCETAAVAGLAVLAARM